LICHQGEEGWEDVDDDEEAIEVSGSPFAPASDYLGKRLGINIDVTLNPMETIIEAHMKASWCCD